MIKDFKITRQKRCMSPHIQNLNPINCKEAAALSVILDKNAWITNRLFSEEDGRMLTNVRPSTCNVTNVYQKLP